MNILATCGAGSGIKLEGDLRGSITSVYEREKTQGKVIQDIVARIIELMPPEQRLAAYNAYLSCVSNLVGRGNGSGRDTSGREDTRTGTALNPGAVTKSSFIGAWSVVDPRLQSAFATVELMSTGELSTGSWGRSFGGPNPLGANQWRFENGLLKFLYISPGRPRIDEMLVGAVRDVSPSGFQFSVVGGYYGQPNKSMVLAFKKL